MPQTNPASADVQQDAPLIPLPADPPQRRRLAAMFSTLVSLALLVMVAEQFRHMEPAAIMAMVPRGGEFWLTFAVWYLAMPLSEWVIYHRLWNLPLSGIGALMRKLVSNELLLGYLGEAQFYAWARSKLDMPTAPFGAIKDVTILSALTGNIATMVMLVFAWPLVASGAIGMELRSVFISLSVVLGTSFIMLLLRRRLFSLPRAELRMITAIHFLRIGALVLLSALMWHWVLPAVPVALWLVLATLRMLVSRLPLIPNKDVVFAGLAVYLIGRETEVADMLTMMAALSLLAHLAVGSVFALSGLINEARGK
ncbi:MAG: hypothetical protein RLZZ84_1887 [Pseudomonadota bacterium]|jgi:hypothetical protein